jgi:hypothetical protein
MSYLHRQVLANFFREIERPALTALEAAAAAAVPAFAPLTTAAIEVGGQILHSALDQGGGSTAGNPAESPEAAQAPPAIPVAAQNDVLGKVAALAGAVESIAAQLAALRASLAT